MMSRRRLLAGATAVAVAVFLRRQTEDARTVVDVRKFGARGDGATDDSRAIQAAVAALRSKGTLYFPRGVYRFALRHPPGGAAIVITGVSDVEVVFEPGAELHMDNLDPATHTGTSHGLLVRGPASRISLRNVNIRWTYGATRSLGDGIRVLGCPTFGKAPPSGWAGPMAPVDGIAVHDCVVRASPQTGVTMLGVSDITVAGLQVADTGADGMHFNACRQATIDLYSAVDTGDDGLALVTYFDPQFAFDEAAYTFSFPSLTDWSNADFAIKRVSVVGGKANGIRLAGANRVTIGELQVVGVRSGSAVMADSAEPSTDAGWNYVASREVRFTEVIAMNCDMGVHLLARPGASGELRFTDFDLHIDEAKLGGCGNWSVRAESLTEHQVGGLRLQKCSISSTSTTGGNGGVGITNAHGIFLGDVAIRQSEPVVAFTAVNVGQLTVDRLSVVIEASEQPAETAKPSVSLDGSDGVINEMELSWVAAPDAWIALRQSTTGQCVDAMREAPVAIRNFKRIPPVSNSTDDCS